MRWGGPSTAEASHGHHGKLVAGQVGDSNRLMGKHPESFIPEPASSSLRELGLPPCRTSAPPLQTGEGKNPPRSRLACKCFETGLVPPAGTAVASKSSKRCLGGDPSVFQLFPKQADLVFSLPSPPRPKLPSSTFAVDSREPGSPEMGAALPEPAIPPHPCSGEAFWPGCVGLIGNPAHLSNPSPKAAVGLKGGCSSHNPHSTFPAKTGGERE